MGGDSITAYAKPCKFCNKISIVWRKEGERNIPVEVMTMQDHTREKCDAAKTGGLGLGKYSPQGQKEFVEQYRPSPEQKPQEALDKDAEFTNAALDIVVRTQKEMNVKIDNLNLAITKVMSLVQYIIDNTGTAKEISELKTVNAELRAVLAKREDNFVPANQVKQTEEESQQEHDQHVRDMVAKGRSEEELEI